MINIKNEQFCNSLFYTEGPFWHLCTSGINRSIIFTCEEDYSFGINSMALALAETQGVSLWSYSIMSNHIHEIVSGTKESCLAYFYARKKKLIRYFAKKDNSIDWDGFSPKLIDINSLEQMRIEILYVHRNGYVANPLVTPYSYPWSSAIYFYNNLLKNLDATPYNSLTYRDKRSLTRSEPKELADSLLVYKDMFFPPSFCLIDKSEQFFRDAHHYFIKLAKPTEEKSVISLALKERIFLSDEEMYPTVCQLGFSKYGKAVPNLLLPSERMELASIMHNQYNANNKQINRILRIPIEQLSELFGKL